MKINSKKYLAIMVNCIEPSFFFLLISPKRHFKLRNKYFSKTSNRNCILFHKTAVTRSKTKLININRDKYFFNIKLETVTYYSGKRIIRLKYSAFPVQQARSNILIVTHRWSSETVKLPLISSL